MKKVFTFMASCLMALAASAQTYELRTLTFEDSDYVGGEANYLGNSTNYWSTLIDNPQYGGDLLYGENHGDTAAVYTSTNYKWYDKGNTYLYSELPENYGVTMYWGGGHAISNYWNGDLNEGDYLHQLSVFVADNASSGQGGHGHNGSDNFCVHFGYMDGSPYNGTQNLPFVTFKDNTARYIDSMWINNTTYAVNCMLRGNDLTEPLSNDDFIWIEATGYNGSNPEFTKEFSLLENNGTPIKEWTKWNWNDDTNAPVTRVEFNILSTVENNYGFSLPAYFAYDDVAVRTPIASSRSNKQARKAVEADGVKCIIITLSNSDENGNSVPLYGVATGDVPEGLIINVESDGTMTKQLAKNEHRRISISGLPNGTTINRLAASVGVLATGRGAGKMIASIDDTEMAELLWRGKNISYEHYGTVVSETFTDLDFEFFENATTTCNDKLVIDCYNVEISEKKAFTAVVNASTWYIYYTDGTPVAINEINADEEQSAELYTLQGTRVSAPVKGQVYVKNGRKVIF